MQFPTPPSGARAAWRRWRSLAAALITAVAATAGAQQRGPADPPSDDSERALDGLHAGLARAFGLAPALGIDADLRAAAQAMVDRELPRIRQVLSAWLADERSQTPGASPGDQLHAVTLRAYNEMTLWQLDSDGPEHDRRQQRAFAHPRACDVAKDNSSFLGRLVQVWQQVPREQRAEHLAAEARLLARWGRTRPPAPARPAAAVEAGAWQAIDAFAKAGTPLPKPLPPILAWRVLNTRDEAATRAGVENRCVLRQWALGVALEKSPGGLSDAEWLAHRYANAPDVLTWWARRDGPAEAPGDYPELARRLQVEGEVTVSIVADAQGRFQRAEVVRRELRAPGIRGQRPVAYETLLDAAALARAATERLPEGSGRPATYSLPVGFRLQ